jgi:serine/threonine-protein kinase
VPQPFITGLQPGVEFQERYQIVRCIKAGGMGAVYEVIDQKTASRRALKVMLPSLLSNESLRARFELEAKITGAIESDHLVRVLDAGVDAASEMPFLIMELLRGEDLSTVTQARGSLLPQEVAIYILQVSRALDKTHAAGVVHRDLKPDNLFLTYRDDGSPCVKVLDFGIAKVADYHASSIETRPMMGTPLYMAPEQIRAEPTIGPGTDIYALAHITYSLLTGEPYWRQELDAAASPYLLAVDVMQGVQDPPSERARRRRGIELPQAFDAWFIRATSQKPEDRFERASAAAQALGEVLGMSAQPVGHYPPPSPVSLGRDAVADTLAKVGRAPPPPPNQGATEAASPGAKKTGLGAPKSHEGLRVAPTVQERISDIPPADAAPRPRSSDPGRRSGPPSRESGLADSPSGIGLVKKKGHLITIDRSRSILKVKVWGFWTLDDAKAYWEDFKIHVAMISGRPWYVLADISTFPAQKPEVGAFVKKTMDYAGVNGMVRAANLVESTLGKMQIARLSAESGLPAFSFFQSEAEAIRWLLTAAA